MPVPGSDSATREECWGQVRRAFPSSPRRVWDSRQPREDASGFLSCPLFPPCRPRFLKWRVTTATPFPCEAAGGWDPSRAGGQTAGPAQDTEAQRRERSVPSIVRLVPEGVRATEGCGTKPWSCLTRAPQLSDSALPSLWSCSVPRLEPGARHAGRETGYRPLPLGQPGPRGGDTGLSRA